MKNKHIRQWNKNQSRFKPYGTTGRTTNISIEQIVRNWGIFFDEIEKCEKKAKKIKQSITILSIKDTGLITSTVLTGGISIAALASRVGLPVSIALGKAGPLFSLWHPPHENM